jgi:hypothetical protein
MQPEMLYNNIALTTLQLQIPCSFGWLMENGEEPEYKVDSLISRLNSSPDWT